MSNTHYAFNLRTEEKDREHLKLRTVASAKYGGDWHSTSHVHNYTELFYIIGGKGQFRIEDELFPVSENQLVIINPDIIHTEVSYETHPLEYIVVGIEGLKLLPTQNNDSRFCIFSYTRQDTALACMQNILREMQNREPEYLTVCKAYMDILIVQLMRDARFSVVSTQPASLSNRQCSLIHRYIEEHYKERLTLDMLAGEAKINKYYLAHIFKQNYGISPINHMIACRIRESKRLLTETDLSLSQISGVLGFSSPSYFSQTFRKAEGVSPAEYRRANHLG